MGAAETGSGKTLAYGLPILDFLLKCREEKMEGEEDKDEREGEAGYKYGALAALILCPTRELALQVTEHLQDMLMGDTAPGRARINVVGIVGGLSDTKQARLLRRRPEVVVATVGRCWEMIQNGQEGHLREMGRLRFLVLDEADRMVEEGHFPEMQSLLTRVVEQGKTYQRDYDEVRRMKREEEKKAKLFLQQQGRKDKMSKEEKVVVVEEEDEEDEKEEEEEGEEEDLCEVPTKSLKDILKEAKRMGLKGLHGLEELEDEEEEEDEGVGEGEEEDDILIDGSVDEVEEEEEEEEEEEKEEEEEGVGEAEEMVVHDDEEKQTEEVERNGEERETPPASVRELPPPVTRQTLIFSATLVMPEEMREGKGGKKGGKKQQKKGKGGKDGKDVMARIMREVGMRGAPAIVDLTSGAAKKQDAAAAAAAAAAVAADAHPLPLPTTPRTATAATGGAPPLALPTGLQLSHVKSVGGHKDAHLYYFLRRYPGRTIIFTNSIDQTRRLAQLLTLLRLPAKALHAKMQQRARLKSLDYFRSQTAAVLVATDVAARGLDIPLVEHVIHYDLPRSLEVFVHRAGRTARANRKGLSFSLVAPRDENMHAEVCRTLLSAPTTEEGEEVEEEGVGEEGQGQQLSMTTFPVDLQELNGARERVHLAGKIVGYEQEAGKQQASQSWFLKRAREADLELDEDLLEETEAGTEKERQRARQMGLDRQRLNELLLAPLVQQRRKFINVAEKLQGLKQAEGCKDAIQVVAKTVGAAKAARRKDMRNRKGGSGGT